MTRGHRTTLTAAAALGALVGAVLTLIFVDGNSPEPAAQHVGLATSTSARAAPAIDPTPPVLLAWTSGGLPGGFAEALEATPGVDAATIVKGGDAGLVRSTDAAGTQVDHVNPGWAVPLDVIAIDPPSFATFTADPARATVTALQPGQALLTESSAGLRGLDVGGSVELQGGRLVIAGIVDDVSGAGAELIVHQSDADSLGIGVERYALVRYAPGKREAVSRSLADLAGAAAIRFRSPSETTWLRHGDAVAPQLFVKLAFGEFAVRDDDGRSVEIDPMWVERNIVTAKLPLLGEVRCHRSMIEPLTAVLTELASANLGHLVDVAEFAGCWNPRRIDDDLPLSRHAWGVAIDLNIDANPRGSFSTQDPRLVDLMRSAGFTWGGTWLVPDPGHYELVPTEPTRLSSSEPSVAD